MYRFLHALFSLVAFLFCLFCLVALVGFSAGIGFGMSASTPKVYDCSMASFHPDYPAKVRADCQKGK